MFRTAHEELGVAVDESHILACGYAPEKAVNALQALADREGALPRGMFVNSTISLEGVMRWIKGSHHFSDDPPVIGCFDWDPFVALLADNIEMVRQDVSGMLQSVFRIIDDGGTALPLIEVPPIFDSHAR